MEFYGIVLLLALDRLSSPLQIKHIYPPLVHNAGSHFIHLVELRQSVLKFDSKERTQQQDLNPNLQIKVPGVYACDHCTTILHLICLANPCETQCCNKAVYDNDVVPIMKNLLYQATMYM